MATAYEREQLLREAQEADAQMEHWTSRHQARFASAQPASPKERPRPAAVTVTPPPQAPDTASASAELSAGIARWKLGQRRLARKLAPQYAQQQHQQQLAHHAALTAQLPERQQAHAAVCAHLDAEEAAERRLLEFAFAQHQGDLPRLAAEIAAAAAKETGHSARSAHSEPGWIVLIVKATEAGQLPERTVGTTKSGSPTAKKRNQTEVNELRAQLLASAAIAAGRLALAMGPTLERCTVIGVDEDDDPVLEVTIPSGAARPAVHALDALKQMNGTIARKGRTGKLAPIALDPATAALI